MSSSEKFKSSPKNVYLNDLSPVTNLALNLKNLSSYFKESPRRSVSLSSSSRENLVKLFVEDHNISDDHFPTFQRNNCLEKWKSQTSPSSDCYHADSDEVYQNVACENAVSFRVDERMYSITKQNAQNNILPKTSDIKPSLNLDSPPLQNKNSMMVEDRSKDGFEELISTEFVGKENDFENMPNILNLLTKPLSISLKGKLTPKKLKRKSRLSIRRCLSVEMENSIDEHNQVSASETDRSVSLSNCAYSSTNCSLYSSGLCLSSSKRRRKSFMSTSLPENKMYPFQRSYSETAATIMHAVQQSDLNPDLIGDCSMFYILPIMKGYHQDLKCISAQTLACVLQGEYCQEIDKMTLVDCRYPYEFGGGHIQGAINIYSKDAIQEILLNDPQLPSKRKIIIFYCEFSSERAPNLCRFLRKKDREMNESSYPKLFYPEIYLLDGGYKSFFDSFKEYCQPQGYRPMNHKDYIFECKHFRSKSKSWGSDSKTHIRKNE